MCEKLNILKKNNYNPDGIIDIGANRGHWTSNMLSIYPTQNYYLFEPTQYPELNRFKNNSNVFIKNVLLYDKIDEVDWYENTSTGDSIFKENTKLYEDVTPIKKHTIDLDTLCIRDNILKNEKNILMKIDCQGAEIPILKGCKNIIKNIDFIILEIPLFGEYNKDVSNFSEHIKFMYNLGFVLFEKLDDHYFNIFNIQVDILFIKQDIDFYKKFLKNPIIHSILLSQCTRQHVINYVNNKKIYNDTYKVIDIGGSANYTNWSYSIIDYIIDINEPNIDNNSKIKVIKCNVNYESEIKKLIDHVNVNGKFDFCICSHIIEDISLPQVLLNNLKYIAKEGFIAIPSKYSELSKHGTNDYMGSIHHRWIYSIKNNNLIGFPKVNFIDTEQKLKDISNLDCNIMDLSFFWKNDVIYSIINDNYLGPDIQSVINYYDELILDDIDNLKDTIYHIEQVKQYNSINGDFIQILMLIENLVTDLKIMENYGFIPYNIFNKNENFGKYDIHIQFINKKHKYNNDVIEVIKSIK